jgi:hypothetical protein
LQHNNFYFLWHALCSQNDHALHETAVAGNAVSRQADELKNLVGQFMLPGQGQGASVKEQ